MKPKYDTAAHCKYNLQYHIIWCPKFRFSALDGPVADVLKDILVSICETYHYEIKALEVTPDHIHIFLSAPQTVAPCDIARTLKSRSAIQLFAAFPELKSFYAKCGVLWSRGYYIASAGQISAETVKKHIEEQKTRW